MARPETMIKDAKKMPLYESAGVLYLNAACARWQSDPSEAWASLSRLSKREFRLTNWSSADVAKLDEGLDDFGDDLAEVHNMLPNKPYSDLINYVYVRRPAM